MQIQLKETEIVAALKDYISNKGIDLTGKSVNITFTASRKEAGTSAEMTIEDLGIPAFTANEEENAHASAAVVALVKAATPEPLATVVEVAEQTVTDEPVANPEEATTAKPVSLFS